ncbi:sigma-70 family RNA polymerase sigma factor [Jatrophihabitans sp. YIM 134969]
MVVNEVVSWRRKWARSVPHADPVLPAVADTTDRHAQLDALLAEIRKLPARQRVVIALRYFADLSDEQIAADLGCAPATVRVHASRALAALRVSPELAASAEESP